MVKKLQDNLAAVAALIGVVGAIGAGFITYGKMQEQINSVAGLDLNPLIKEISAQNIKIEKQNKELAIMGKEIQVLQLEMQEFKASNKNPLLN
jgi:outer membrane lipoprotein SlyB